MAPKTDISPDLKAWLDKLASNNPYSASNMHLTPEHSSMEEQGSYKPQVAGSIPAAPTKQRWSREAYNAYQRDYMKRRRDGYRAASQERS